MPPASSEASVDEFLAFFAAKKMKVLTFIGYSGAGYEDPAAMRATAARKLGKPVRFVPADMRHAAAREKAARTGRPLPTDFGGSAARIFP